MHKKKKPQLRRIGIALEEPEAKPEREKSRKPEATPEKSTSAALDPVHEIADRVGLDRACAASNKVYVHGDQLFVAGTSSLGDAVDDTGIPFGMTSRSQRGIDVDKVLQKMPQIRRVVGHSLGGAVALDVQGRRPELKTTTYGAPVASFQGGERYRHYGDPVSALDFGAHNSAPKGLNPHNYQDLASQVHTAGPGVGEGSYDQGGVVHMYQ